MCWRVCWCRETRQCTRSWFTVVIAVCFKASIEHVFLLFLKNMMDKQMNGAKTPPCLEQCCHTSV